MKTLITLILTLTSMLTIVNTSMTHAETLVESKSAAETKTLMQRLKMATLPGLHDHRSSSKTFSYLTSPVKPNHFRAPFKEGQSRLYVNDRHSPFAVDPHTPEGNVFDFKF